VGEYADQNQRDYRPCVTAARGGKIGVTLESDDGKLRPPALVCTPFDIVADRASDCLCAIANGTGILRK